MNGTGVLEEMGRRLELDHLLEREVTASTPPPGRRSLPTDPLTHSPSPPLTPSRHPSPPHPPTLTLPPSPSHPPALSPPHPSTLTRPRCTPSPEESCSGSPSRQSSCARRDKLSNHTPPRGGDPHTPPTLPAGGRVPLRRAVLVPRHPTAHDGGGPLPARPARPARPPAAHVPLSSHPAPPPLPARPLPAPALARSTSSAPWSLTTRRRRAARPTRQSMSS